MTKKKIPAYSRVDTKQTSYIWYKYMYSFSSRFLITGGLLFVAVLVSGTIFRHTIRPADAASSVQPTPTPQQLVSTKSSLTSMNMTIYLDDIGSRGDNTNPTDSSYSNKNPQDTTLYADIWVYTTDNNLIASGTGTFTYNTTKGAYTGDIPISAGFPTGEYLIAVKTNSHLRKMIDQIQTITANQDNIITPVSLVAGDVNNDNSLNILDYNLLLGCYSDLTAAPNCPTQQDKVNSDLNDDGAVNQIDYNIFIRELASQLGD